MPLFGLREAGIQAAQFDKLAPKNGEPQRVVPAAATSGGDHANQWCVEALFDNQQQMVEPVATLPTDTPNGC